MSLGWKRNFVLVLGMICGLEFPVADLFGQAFSTFDSAKEAQAFRQKTPVPATADGNIVCEAEEFQIEKPGGWQAGNWGSNYYASTLANTFLSRKAYLSAPPQCDRSVATIEINVREAGRYLALVRYEATYRFETQFQLQVEQGGQKKLDRQYGARKNLKIWAFSQKLKSELAWDWGAVENVVWEGHDAYVDLQPGTAKLTLIADKQMGNSAKRNVDLVLLTKNEAEVKQRIEKENYLPLDGMLTQIEDVYLKVHNQADGTQMKLIVPPCTEHSPYWVHLRNWKAKTIDVEAGKSTDWEEVGSLMDSLNDGQWNIAAAPPTQGAALHYKLEFGVKDAKGKITSIATFESRSVTLGIAFDADTRYSRRIRTTDSVLYDLLDYLKKNPVPGKLPERTLIYATTFDKRPDDPKYNAAVDEFSKMFALSVRDPKLVQNKLFPSGYVDVRANPLDEKMYKTWQAEGIADKIAVVSLGDEIGLASPPANDQAGFQQWLQAKGLKPADVVPAAGGDWAKVVYNIAPALMQTDPGLYYYSRLYAHHFAIQNQKKTTDFVKKFLPNAHVGANFSPHHGYHYLGETHMWATLFREGGMTLPWSEDYIWQVPIGTQQMNFISLDLFRAGLKGKPNAKIQFYVMPHWGNTPNSWRRQFYGDLAHGMQIVDLFEFRPVQAAYTENHADQPEMFLEIRRSFSQLGLFEDIVQDGHVRPGTAALWFSETGDIWNDNKPPFGAAKRCLYIALKQQQLPLDFVIEEDALDGSLKQYKILYLADQHVSRAASKAIADWVQNGGLLFATAGAGMLNELNQPNQIMRDLLGVDQTALEIVEGDALKLEKQDLPFAKDIDVVTGPFTPGANPVQMQVIAVRSRVKINGAKQAGTFADGTPAVTFYQKAGSKGGAYYAGFLPGLTYFKPAIPLRPVDRGSTDDSMAHFIPTAFDPGAAGVLSAPIDETCQPVTCSQPLVETSIIESKQGTLIPLINWSEGPVQGLTVTVSVKLTGKTATLASGKKVVMKTDARKTVFTFDLDVADALILR